MHRVAPSAANPVPARHGRGQAQGARLAHVAGSAPGPAGKPGWPPPRSPCPGPSGNPAAGPGWPVAGAAAVTGERGRRPRERVPQCGSAWPSVRGFRQYGELGGLQRFAAFL